MHVSFQGPYTYLDMILTLQTPGKTGSKIPSSQSQLQPSVLYLQPGKYCYQQVLLYHSKLFFQLSPASSLRAPR